MRLQEVGGLTDSNDAYLFDSLQSSWHSRTLTPAQIAAYIRYLFIYLQEGVADWDSPEHTNPRRHWDGGRTPDGTRHKNIWQAILQKNIQPAGAHPGVWVAAHFSPVARAVRTAKGKGTIYGLPSMLAGGEYSKDVYDTYIHYFPDTLTDRLASALASFRSRFEITKALNLPDDDHFLLVICDKSYVNATPLIRYAMAAERGCKRAARKHITGAALAYEINQPLYDAYVAARPEHAWLIPQSLKNAVVKIREYWRQYE